MEKSNKQVWKKMGRELAVLDALIQQIQADPDYCDVMDVKTWDRLTKMHHQLDVIRGDAESRMARFVPDWSTRTFYPDDWKGLYETADKIRKTAIAVLERK